MKTLFAIVLFLLGIAVLVYTVPVDTTDWDPEQSARATPGGRPWWATALGSVALIGGSILLAVVRRQASVVRNLGASAPTR